MLDIYLENNSTHIPVSDQTVNARFFNPNLGTLDKYSFKTDKNGHIAFNYTRPNIVNVGTDFNITFEIPNASVKVEQNVTVRFVALGSIVNEVNTTNYNLIAIPNNVNISSNKDTKILELYVENNLTHIPVSDINVTASFLNPFSGILDKYRASTDSTGKATFNYSAPSILPINTSYKVSFNIDKATNSRERNVSINFLSTLVNSSSYTFSVSPSDTNITIGGESRTIEAFISNNSQPVENENVIVEFTSVTQGRMSSFNGKTDSNGMIAFRYTSPLDISTLYGTSHNIILKMESNNSKSGTAKISFVNSKSNYTLTSVPSELNVSVAGQVKTIDLYLYDLVLNRVIANEDINVSAFVAGNGVLDNYGVKTDKNGHAVFNYTVPLDLSVRSFDINFKVLNTSGETNTTINIVSPPTSDFSDYNLTLLSNEINITKAGQQSIIDVYLKKGNSPANGENILIKFFDGSKGTLNAFNGKIDTTGHISFTYIAPNNLIGLNGYQINISMENNSSQEQNITLNVSQIDYNISSNSNIIIDTKDASYSITVGLSSKVVGGTFVPAVGKIIVAEYLMPIFGTINKYELTVGNSGTVTFDYTAPSDIVNIQDTNVTFYYKDDHTVLSRTLLKFNGQTSQSASTLYVLPTSITITSPLEEQNITIVTVNSQNIGVSTDVTLEQPNNGTDYGNFSQTRFTTGLDGTIQIKYTAPASLVGLIERNITVRETKQNLVSKLNIKYALAGKSNSYEVSLVTKKSYPVNIEDQITVLIHAFGDTNTLITDAQVLDVNVTTIYPLMLNLNGTNSFNYNLKASKPVTVNPQITSGSAIINVSATIFDGTKNVDINKSFPVIISSGPVASLSMFFRKQGLNADFGTFENYYTVHAVDKYNNPANAGINLHPSAINGKVVPSNNIIPTAGIMVPGTGVSDTFRDNSSPFGQVNISDILTIIPSSSKNNNSYLGSWSISTKTSNVLTLIEDYIGNLETGLSYIVGNSNRYINGYGIATIDIKSSTGDYKTDANGNTEFVVSFDPILAGHTFVLSASAYDVNRTGVAMVTSLRWDTYKTTSVKIANQIGNFIDKNVTLSLGIDTGIEPLVGLRIAPQSIVSSDAACDLNTSKNNVNNLTTNSNGDITVIITTGLGASQVSECVISWSKSPSSIGREY